MGIAQPKTLGPARRPQPNFEKRKLRALVAAWQSKKPELVTTKKRTWAEFLARLGYEKRPVGWPIALGGDPRLVRKLSDYLAEADEDTRKLAHQEIRDGIERELELFAQGLAENGASARFAFALDGARLEELANLVGIENFQDRVDEALSSFDTEFQARREKISSRLAWKPEKPQRRVNFGVTASKYTPGQPNWWSGKLNDAPELIGHKLDADEAEQVAIKLERSLLLHYGKTDVPCAKWPKVTLNNTYFAQGREPRVQFGQVGEAPGVEGYLKDKPFGGPRVLEFPLEDGEFAYLMFDGHHRAAAQMFRGRDRFKDVTIMRLTDVEERFGHSKQDILEAIRDLHTHLYMTEAPVPR